MFLLNIPKVFSIFVKRPIRYITIYENFEHIEKKCLNNIINDFKLVQQPVS